MDNRNSIESIFKSTYPSWTISDCGKVTSLLFKKCFGNLKQDPNFISEVINEGFCIIKKRHPNFNQKETLQYWKNSGFHSELIRVVNPIKSDSIDYFPTEDQLEDYIKFTYNNEVDEFVKVVLRKDFLTKNELVLFSLLCDLVSTEDEYKDVYESLKNHAFELGFSSENFRQTFSRLKKSMKQNIAENDLNLLYFMQNNNNKKKIIMDLIMNYKFELSEFKLEAYRFSSEEIDKMNTLKKLFLENNFNIDRFPSIYYSDMEQEFEISDFDNLDRLGVYRFSLLKENEDEDSKEGCIILYKNAIERFCAYHTISEDAVRLLVLMHELGHWFVHWSEYKVGNEEDNEKKNGSKFYRKDNRKTKESLAQLIAYWFIEENQSYTSILTDKLSGKLNSEYGLYKELLHKPKGEILQKIAKIQQHLFLPDDILFEYLKSTILDLNEFVLYVICDEIDVRNEKEFFDGWSKQEEFYVNVFSNNAEVILKDLKRILPRWYNFIYDHIDKIINLINDDEIKKEWEEFRFEKRVTILGRQYGI